MAGKPYFTGFLRVAFLNSGFATKLSLGCSDICKMHKYRIGKEEILYILYNGHFCFLKCPAVRRDIFVPTPGKTGVIRHDYCAFWHSQETQAFCFYTTGFHNIVPKVHPQGAEFKILKAQAFRAVLQGNPAFFLINHSAGT